MKEYIDRKALLENIKKYQNDVFGIPMIIAEIENMPAANVKKVVHGKWLSEYPVLEPNPMFACGICSECGAVTCCTTDYCGYCNAKMDLKLELTEYEEKCLFCKHNYKPLNCIPKCNRMCDHYSDFELIEDIKDKFK